MRGGLVLIALCFAIASAIYNDFLPIPGGVPVLDRKWDWYGLTALATVFFVLFTDFQYWDSALTRFLKIYGDISYSTYLFHFLFIGIAVLAVTHFSIYGDSPKLFFVFFFTLISTYFAARFFYRYVELPGIRFGRMIVAGLFAGNKIVKNPTG